MNVRYYHLRLEEINGEQEYYHDFLVIAKDRKEARKFARQHAHEWYADDNVEEIETDVFEFFHGCIIVKIVDLSDTTREMFIDRMLNVMTLNPGSYEIPKPKTIISINGGCLNSVYSEIDTEIELFDYDNAQCGDGDFSTKKTDHYIMTEVKRLNMHHCY